MNFLLNLFIININKNVPKILPMKLNEPNKPNFLLSMFKYNFIYEEADEKIPMLNINKI